MRIKIGKNISYNILGIAVKTCLQIVQIFILSRVLLPMDFGKAAIISLPFNFLLNFNQVGISSSYIFFDSTGYSESYINTYYFTKTIRRSFYLLLLMAIFIPIYLYLINQFSLIYLGILMLLIIPLRSFTNMSESVLQKKFDFVNLYKFDISSYLFGYFIVSITLGLLGLGALSIVIALIVQYLFQTVVYYMLLKPKFSFQKIEIKDSNKIENYGRNNTIATVFNYFTEEYDNYFISMKFGAEILGYYGKGFQLLSIPSRIINTILDKFFFILLSENKHDNKFILNHFYKLHLYVFFVSSILVFFSFFYTKEIILLLLGENWLQTVPYYRILSLVIVFRTSTKVNKTFLKSLGQVKSLKNNQMFSLVFFITFISFFGTSFGSIGVAYGVLVASGLNLFTTFFRLIRYL